MSWNRKDKGQSKGVEALTFETNTDLETAIAAGKLKVGQIVNVDGTLKIWNGTEAEEIATTDKSQTLQHKTLYNNSSTSLTTLKGNYIIRTADVAEKEYYLRGPLLQQIESPYMPKNHTYFPFSATYTSSHYLVSTDASQELKNKTLIQPLIATIRNKDNENQLVSITVPKKTGTLALWEDVVSEVANVDLSNYATLDGEETLENKTLTLTQYGNYGYLPVSVSDATLKIHFPRLTTHGTKIYLLSDDADQYMDNKRITNTNSLSNSALTSESGGTINFPNPATNASTTLATTAGTETLTNKTLVAPNIVSDTTQNAIHYTLPITTNQNTTLVDTHAQQDILNKTLVAPKIKKTSEATYTASFPTISENCEIVATSATQTLSNKTLIAPIMKNSSVSTYSASFPTITENSELLTTSSTQTIKNKTLDSANTTLSTNILKLKNGNNTISLTLPAAADAYMCDLTSSQTLENKTLKLTQYGNYGYLPISVSDATIRINFPRLPSSGTNVFLLSDSADQYMDSKRITNTNSLSNSALKSQNGGTINFPNPSSGNSVTLATTAQLQSASVPTHSSVSIAPFSSSTSSGSFTLNSFGPVRYFYGSFSPSSNQSAGANFCICENYYTSTEHYIPCGMRDNSRTFYSAMLEVKNTGVFLRIGSNLSSTMTFYLGATWIIDPNETETITASS